MQEIVFSCTDCVAEACARGDGAYPAFCLTGRMTREDVDACVERYHSDEHALSVMRGASASSNRACGERLSRIEETMDFAARMGYRKIGVATCLALAEDARQLASMLRAHGFEPFGAACKVGGIARSMLEADGSVCDYGFASCNPILQAKLLNEAGTDLNVVMGLCVGHDSLFHQHAKAPCTTLAVKDYRSGHNPLSAFRSEEAGALRERLLAGGFELP